MTHDIAIALAAIDIIALGTAVGSVACLLWIAPCTAADRNGRGSRAIWRLLGICLGLLTVDSPAILLVRAHVLSDQPYSLLAPVLPVVLAHTHFGFVWLVRAASIAVLWILWWTGHARPQRRGWLWGLLAVVAVTAFTRSATGHAADQGDFTAHEIMDWLHVLVASVWAGSVAASTLTVLGAAAPGEAAAGAFNALAYRLSSLATVALPLMLATGAYNALKQFGGVGELWRTDYGLHFLLKMVLVIVMLGLGAFNRFFHLNRLPRPAAADPQAPAADPSGAGEPGVRQAFRRVLLIEALVAVGVFVAVAVMINTAPPRHGMDGMPM